MYPILNDSKLEVPNSGRKKKYKETERNINPLVITFEILFGYEQLKIRMNNKQLKFETV